MKNKKRFTLIGLLAVIVILAIIMVVAIPQILNVINNSRKSSWDSNVKLVAKSIDLNNTMDQTGVIGNGQAAGQSTATGQTQGYPLSSLCNNGALTNFDKITEVGDINYSASSCSKNGNTYTFTLKGQNQFKGYEATIECTTSKACKINETTYGTASSSGSGSGSSTHTYAYLATSYENSLFHETDTIDDHSNVYIKYATNELCIDQDKCFTFDDYDRSNGKVNKNGTKTQALLSRFGVTETDSSSTDNGQYYYDSDAGSISFAFTGNHAYYFGCTLTGTRATCYDYSNSYCYIGDSTGCID